MADISLIKVKKDCMRSKMVEKISPLEYEHWAVEYKYSKYRYKSFWKAFMKFIYFYIKYA